MDRNELRQACYDAANKAGIGSRAAPPVLDAVIRTVIDEVAGMLLVHAKQEHDAFRLSRDPGYLGAYYIYRASASFARSLLPSTDSEDA